MWPKQANKTQEWKVDRGAIYCESNKLFGNFVLDTIDGSVAPGAILAVNKPDKAKDSQKFIFVKIDV